MTHQNPEQTPPASHKAELIDDDMLPPVNRIQPLITGIPERFKSPEQSSSAVQTGDIVSVIRSNGQVDSDWKVVEVMDRKVLVEKEIDGEVYEKLVTFENLERARQQFDVGHKLAGTATKGEVNLEGAVEIRFEDLSEQAQYEVEQHRQLLKFKRELERENDFSEAGRTRQAITSLERSMSDEAKRFLKLL